MYLMASIEYKTTIMTVFFLILNKIYIIKMTNNCKNKHLIQIIICLDKLIAKMLKRRILFLQNSTRRLATLVENRNSAYSVLTDVDFSFFEKLLGKTQCVTDSARLSSFNVDWMKSCHGQSKLALLPRSTQELSEIMRYCNQRSLAVCPQGGNTGLVGGSVPVYDEVVISTRLMNQIISLDKDSRILNAQSGCILQSLDDHVDKEADLMMPLDLGAKGSCHIGGNVATNAGGLRLLRYGSLKGNVLGLEVVLADGKGLNLMNAPLRKDNTGYDIKQLFIGSEGTLGIISGVSILCPLKPKAANLILIACKQPTFQNVIDVFRVAKSELNEILSAFEFMDKDSMSTVNRNLKLENPFRAVDKDISDNCQFYCLAETHGSCNEHDVKKIEKFFERLLSENLCKDAIIAENKAQFDSIWSLRERIAESLVKEGYNYKYDISLPINRMYELAIDLRKRVQNSKSSNIVKSCVAYGHMGDGNLHLNLTSDKYSEELFNLLEPFIFEWTRENNGSISAEHGLGLKKRNYIHYSKTKESVEYMQQVKYMFDPKLILNPYKTIPY
jgi:D-2-hydroxyglutarate dehydrogenase